MLSIHEIEEKIKEEKLNSQEDLSDKPMEAFTQDQLLVEWRKFAYSLRESDIAGSNTVFKLMTQKDPELRENEVHFQVENLVVYDLIHTNFGNEILTDLRKNLKNWGISLSIEIHQSIETQHRYLTGKERFEKLLQSNSNLMTLKKIFNLDIEY